MAIEQIEPLIELFGSGEPSAECAGCWAGRTAEASDLADQHRAETRFVRSDVTQHGRRWRDVPSSAGHAEAACRGPLAFKQLNQQVEQIDPAHIAEAGRVQR